MASADGTFTIKGCQPGENLVTASRAGYAAQTIKATLSEGSEPLVLTLTAGKTLRLRVVDTEGNPVPGANVWLNTMHRTLGESSAPVQAKFNPKTGHDGRVLWNEAPDAELSFDIAKSGFMRLGDIKLRSTDEEHLITLQPAVTISGTVTDAVTSKPIPRFQIVAGWPEMALPGREPTFMWSTIDRFSLNFSDGVFRHTFDEPVVMTSVNQGYALKFQAEGYAPFVSRVIRADESDTKLEVKLQPARSSIITVVSADGQALAGADFSQTTVRSMLQVAHHRIVAQFGSTVDRTDANGQIRLMPDPEITGVIIAHESGFRWLQASELDRDIQVKLFPWADISGVLLDEAGTPLSGIKLNLQWQPRAPGTLVGPILPMEASVITDLAGRFRFEDVPPDHLTITEVVEMSMPPHRGWSYRPLGQILAEPGQTASADIVRTNFVHGSAGTPFSAPAMVVPASN